MRQRLKPGRLVKHRLRSLDLSSKSDVNGIQLLRESLPEWVEIVNVVDKSKQQILELQIDKGESSAIALAMEIPDSTIILDDYKARKIAHQLGLSYTGTIGVIVKAKLRGLIPSISPILNKIKQTNFRLTEELELQALKQSGE
ncbi:MAG: DUF3368 domain-containing protein [Pedobacter sp.]|nr:MAG: DUF3368 domain-containing protein [Pedobacter sp.]